MTFVLRGMGNMPKRIILKREVAWNRGRWPCPRNGRACGIKDPFPKTRVNQEKKSIISHLKIGGGKMRWVKTNL